MHTKQRLDAFLGNLSDSGLYVGIGEDSIGIDQPLVCRSVHYISERLVQITDNWNYFVEHARKRKCFLDVKSKIFISPKYSFYIQNIHFIH